MLVRARARECLNTPAFNSHNGPLLVELFKLGMYPFGVSSPQSLEFPGTNILRYKTQKKITTIMTSNAEYSAVFRVIQTNALFKYFDVWFFQLIGCK